MAQTNRLARFLARSKVSYAAFARKVGADRARIQRCATSERRPGLALAVEIERETGIPVAYWPTVKLVKRPVRGSPRRASQDPAHRSA